ncbi:MAG TPA: glycosyl hydrolase [Terriglobales bacterium]|nr:glycosyl hydrolase [Terriglobales bacterium]
MKTVASILIAVSLAAGAFALDARRLARPQDTVPASFFGMHIHRLAEGTAWPNVPFETWRLWDARVSWPQLEPKKGEWKFELLDSYVKSAEEHRVEVLLPLGPCPQWASSRPAEPSSYQPGNAAPPQNMQDWRDYVRTIGLRYQGRIRTYEIWNEPNLPGFFTGTMPQMIELTRVAREVLREIDPSIRIVSPAATEAGGIQWLDQFLAQGGGQYVDVIGYHLYVDPAPPEQMVNRIDDIRAVLARRKLRLPIWNTEAGWAHPKPFPSEDMAAAYVARAYVLSWAAGVSRFYWYAWDNHGWVSLQMTDSAGRPEAPAAAYSEINRWLTGRRVEECKSDAGDNWVCSLSGSSARQWIVWNARRSAAFSLPRDWKVSEVRDLAGRERKISGASLQIGVSPQLLEAAP